jgi:hypothetical protein
MRLTSFLKEENTPTRQKKVEMIKTLEN